MAKLDPNTLIGILRGKLGDLVFVLAKDGTVIVKRRPVRGADFTGPELGNQSRFTQAAAYVKRVRQQPEIYAIYQAAARVSGKRACDLAHADFRHPPIIQDVDLQGYSGRIADPIRVQATDTLGVVSVCLTLAGLDELLLEHGDAHLEPGSSQWLYRAQTELPAGQTIVVHATATDRAGNSVTKTLHHALLPLAQPYA